MGLGGSGIIKSIMKTHSIVTTDCKLREHHVGMLVTYKGVTGWLIRYMETGGCLLFSLSITEARECAKLNSTNED